MVNFSDLSTFRKKDEKANMNYSCGQLTKPGCSFYQTSVAFLTCKPLRKDMKFRTFAAISGMK